MKIGAKNAVFRKVSPFVHPFLPKTPETPCCDDNRMKRLSLPLSCQKPACEEHEDSGVFLVFDEINRKA